MRTLSVYIFERRWADWAGPFRARHIQRRRWCVGLGPVFGCGRKSRSRAIAATERESMAR